jgi:hypothetical protein
VAKASNIWRLFAIVIVKVFLRLDTSVGGISKVTRWILDA